MQKLTQTQVIGIASGKGGVGKTTISVNLAVALQGMGFKVMRSLAAEIGAELQIVSTHFGLSFRLSLPAGAMAGTKLA